MSYIAREYPLLMGFPQSNGYFRNLKSGIELALDLNPNVS